MDLKMENENSPLDIDKADGTPQKKRVNLFWKSIKRILLAAGLLSITLNIIALFDTRPFQFKHLYPEQVGQAFFKLRYPLTPDLSLSAVLQDLRKAEAKCTAASVLPGGPKGTHSKAIRCVYQSGFFANPMWTDYQVDIDLSDNEKVEKIDFHIKKS